jgi:catechol 2,3-dioxygenase-like lactoylglutathione lyase family enzyme
MNEIQTRTLPKASHSGAMPVDMKLEVVVIPVSNVDRAATFYAALGWRMDADIRQGGNRGLQFTPPGSQASIIFGTGVSPSAPGTAQHLFLVVPDIEAARKELVSKGVEPSGIFHDRTGGYNFYDPAVRADGPDPQRRSYASFLTFRDPDGNGWLVQEITTRFPGRVDTAGTSFASARDLAGAMRRAAAAHGEHEKRIGAADPDWPDWYAAHMVAEQSGAEPPR